jgi:hypothetical protein
LSYGSNVSTWTFEDGSELLSGGVVRGNGPAAKRLESYFFYPDRFVQVGPIPMESVELDVGSDYLLDVLANDIAFRVRQQVHTDYEPRDEDVPFNVKQILEAAERAARDNPLTTVF